MKRSRNIPNDKAQTEFVGVVWQTSETHPYRLRAGDVFKFEDRLCRVLRVNDSAAIVLMNRPMREFETRFRGPVRFQPSPTTFRISPNSETKILNRKIK